MSNPWGPFEFHCPICCGSKIAWFVTKKLAFYACGRPSRLRKLVFLMEKAGLSNGFRFTSKLIKVHGNFQSEVSLRSNMKAFWGRIWKKKEDEHYSRFDILKGLEACLARRWNNSDRDKWPQVVEKKGSLNFLPLKLSNVLSDEFVLLCGVLEQELGLSWGFLSL